MKPHAAAAGSPEIAAEMEQARQDFIDKNPGVRTGPRVEPERPAPSRVQPVRERAKPRPFMYHVSTVTDCAREGPDLALAGLHDLLRAATRRCVALRAFLPDTYLPVPSGDSTKQTI